MADQKRAEAQKDIEIADLRNQLRQMRAQLSAETSEKAQLNTKLEEISAKYRAASQQLTALRASQTRKHRLRVRNTVRVIRAASRSALSAVRIKIWQGLRTLKWKLIVPIAIRLGVPQSTVSALRIPTFGRKPSDVITQNATTAETEAFNPPSQQSQEIAVLGWPAPPNDSRTLVLAVMDEFTEGCFGSDVRLLQPRPDNWYGLAQKYPPTVVFIESAWKGNGGSWQYRIGTYNVKPGHELNQMNAWARTQGVPTVFWNKEDPVHHEKFMEAASQADHIFTTDSQMVDSYRKRTGKQSVHALPFAAQPALHKPAPLNGRIPKACFAGSWYGNRHAERGEAMKWLLKVAHKHGLDIYDRNFDTGIFPFPEEYQSGVRGSLPYLELCKEYSRYRIFLNVNSVIDSPTMFSRRVFELMACGTPIVSTYAKGIEDMFQSNAVWLVRNEAEADEAICTLLEDDGEWRRRSLAGIREVFLRHTYAHRLNTIFETIGLSDRIVTKPTVSLIARADDASEIESLFHFAETQVYGPFELFIERSSAISNERTPRKVKFVRRGELSKIALGVSEAVKIGWISPRHTYGPNYLVDLINAIAYQPEAGGWAKSNGIDTFAFGAKVWLSASIWKADLFRSEWMMVEDKLISDDRLFGIDTEEFMPNVNDLKAMQNV